MGGSCYCGCCEHTVRAGVCVLHCFVGCEAAKSGGDEVINVKAQRMWMRVYCTVLYCMRFGVCVLDSWGVGCRILHRVLTDGCGLLLSFSVFACSPLTLDGLVTLGQDRVVVTVARAASEDA